MLIFWKYSSLAVSRLPPHIKAFDLQGERNESTFILIHIHIHIYIYTHIFFKHIYFLCTTYKRGLIFFNAYFWQLYQKLGAVGVWVSFWVFCSIPFIHPSSLWLPRCVCHCGSSIIWDKELWSFWNCPSCLGLLGLSRVFICLSLGFWRGLN